MRSPPQAAADANTHNAVRVVIVDDHIFIRDLTARALSRQKTRYAVVAAVGTAADAVKTCKKLKPDLLILDINLPDKNGIDVLPELRRVASTTRVLLCTGFPTDERISDLAATGAHGFIEKTGSWDEFLRAIDSVSRGELYFCSHSVQSLAASRLRTVPPSACHPRFTARENEVIELIARGYTSKEIASKLHISIATVETHRTNVMTKLGARNVAGIVSYAFRAGLVD
jgi:two-component system, NarL family, response regulator NreC